jgi:hypothetical protein
MGITSNRSSQATRFWNPAVLKVAIPNKQFEFYPGTSIHRLFPMIQVLFPLNFLNRGGVGTPTIITFCGTVFTFIYVRSCLGLDQQHMVESGRQRESGANRHTMQWSETGVVTN